MLCVVSVDDLFFCNDQGTDDYSRNEGALDALIRPLRIPLSDAETRTVATASEPSPTGGLRRSARLAGAHLPRDPSTSAPLRRSARLSTLRG